MAGKQRRKRIAIKGISAFFLTALFLSACEKNENVLSSSSADQQWEKAVKTDTVKGYLEYLANLDPADDVEMPPREDGAYEFYNNRSHFAKRRIFEFGYETATGTCPFSSIYVDLRQDLENVESEADFAYWFGNPMEKLGVEFESEAASADAVLVFELSGRGIEQEYGPLDKPEERFAKISGGEVAGALWFEHRPDYKVSFSGARKPSNFERPGKSLSGGVPSGIWTALIEANLRREFARLIYETCGPEAGVYMYFTRGVFSLVGPMTVSIRELENEMRTDFDKTGPMLLSAAFGPHSASHQFGSGEDAAFDMVIEESHEMRDIVWRAMYGASKAPPWPRKSAVPRE